jgi:hypothetical protein
MDNDPRVPASSFAEGVLQGHLEEPSGAAHQFPDDYAQWLDERRFDEEEGDL